MLNKQWRGDNWNLIEYWKKALRRASLLSSHLNNSWGVLAANYSNKCLALHSQMRGLTFWNKCYTESDYTFYSNFTSHRSKRDVFRGETARVWLKELHGVNLSSRKVSWKLNVLNLKSNPCETMYFRKTLKNNFQAIKRVIWFLNLRFFSVFFFF